MNINLKPHPLVAHWIPGLVAVWTIMLSAYDWDYVSLFQVLEGMPSNNTNTLLRTSILAVIAFPVGEILDAMRGGVIEQSWDYLNQGEWEIRWDFFFRGGTRELKNFHEHYFTWYVLDLNLSSAIFLGYVFCFWLAPVRSFATTHSIAILLWAIVIWGVLLFDAVTLRNEMKCLLDKWHDSNPWPIRNPYRK